MPPMTMVFQLAYPIWIDQFKVGDKVRFAADKVNGAYTVVKIEKTP
jgi:Cu/Ag efflux protein CusF